MRYGVVSERNYAYEIVYGENTAVEVDVLKYGLYQYTAYATDVYGNRFAAGTAVIGIDDGQTATICVTSDVTDYNA